MNIKPGGICRYSGKILKHTFHSCHVQYNRHKKFFKMYQVWLLNDENYTHTSWPWLRITKGNIQKLSLHFPPIYRSYHCIFPQSHSKPHFLTLTHCRIMCQCILRFICEIVNDCHQTLYFVMQDVQRKQQNYVRHPQF